MIYKYSELIDKHGYYAKVQKLINKGVYSKISHGIYTDGKSNLFELESIFARYPNAVLTLQSAFAFYDISDFIPEKYILVTPIKSHRIQNNKVQQMYMSNDLINLGKIQIDTPYGKINIYDKERLLVELFRLKNKLSYAYFKEIVNYYRKEITFGKNFEKTLVEYCLKLRNGSNILKQIQDIIL